MAQYRLKPRDVSTVCFGPIQTGNVLSAAMHKQSVDRAASDRYNTARQRESLAQSVEQLTFNQ